MYFIVWVRRNETSKLSKELVAVENARDIDKEYEGCDLHITKMISKAEFDRMSCSIPVVDLM